MRTTVNIAYGHEEEQYDSMFDVDAPIFEVQKLFESKKERVERSRGVAAKAAQLAMGVRSKQ